MITRRHFNRAAHWFLSAELTLAGVYFAAAIVSKVVW